MITSWTTCLWLCTPLCLIFLCWQCKVLILTSTYNGFLVLSTISVIIISIFHSDWIAGRDASCTVLICNTLYVIEHS